MRDTSSDRITDEDRADWESRLAARRKHTLELLSRCQRWNQSLQALSVRARARVSYGKTSLTLTGEDLERVMLLVEDAACPRRR